MDYSPWGCKELDTTERLPLHFTLVAKSCSALWLFESPCIVARQAPLSMGLFQTRMLGWVVICFLGYLPIPGVEPTAPALAGRLLSPPLFTDSHVHPVAVHQPHILPSF